MPPLTRTILPLLALGLLSGCALFRPKPHPLPDTGKAEAAVSALSSEQAQQASAYVEAGRRANRKAPESPAREATEGSLETAAKALPAPTPEQVAVAMKPVEDALRGDLSEARAKWARAQEAASVLQERLEQAKLDLAAEREAGRRALLEERSRAAADVAAAKRAAEDKALGQQVLYLNLAGGAFALGFGLCVAFGGVALLRAGAWVLGLLSLFAFGLAQIVAAWWFKWAVLGTGLAGAGAFAWYCFKHRSLQAGVDKLTPVVRQVVTVLDTAYDALSADGKALLDSHVFDPLSKAMDKADKQVVREVRATGEK